MWILAIGRARSGGFEGGSFAIAQKRTSGRIRSGTIDISTTATSSRTAWCPRSTLDIIGRERGGGGVRATSFVRRVARPHAIAATRHTFLSTQAGGGRRATSTPPAAALISTGRACQRGAARRRAGPGGPAQPDALPPPLLRRRSATHALGDGDAEKRSIRPMVDALPADPSLIARAAGAEEFRRRSRRKGEAPRGPQIWKEEPRRRAQLCQGQAQELRGLLW